MNVPNDIEGEQLRQISALLQLCVERAARAAEHLRFSFGVEVKGHIADHNMIVSVLQLASSPSYVFKEYQ